MIKIDVKEFKFSAYENDFIYLFKANDKNFTIKRINKDNKAIDIITILNNTVLIKNNKNLMLNNIDKDKIINNIFEVFNQYMIKECIDLEKMIKLIKSSYINPIISDGKIALSKDNNHLNIILLDTNSIIGEISNEFNINVDEYYIKDTLKLLKDYINLFNNTNVFIKKLK